MQLQIKRLLSQLSFFIFANLGFINIRTGLCFPFFYCHACPTASAACPLRAIEKSVYNESFEWKLFIYPFLILGAVGITTGRAVCGWACPIGTLQRGTGHVAKRLKIKIPFFRRIGQRKYEKYFRYIKYINLIAFVIITPYFVKFMFTDICPVGILTGTIPVWALSPEKYEPNPFFYIALIFFVLFFILIFLIERGWCRYFCPVGAILAPMNKVSYLHMKVHPEGCIHCNSCSFECPMGIHVAEMNRDPECILCGKCVKACPTKAIEFARTKL